MKDCILILALILLFAMGVVIMNKIDRYNRKWRSKNR